VVADSQEVAAENGVAANVLDGDLATFWHSKWSNGADPLPHTLTVDMKTPVTVGGVKYLPRAGNANGRIGQYRIEVSTDGTTWGTPVATGTFADNGTEKSATFAGVTARYVRLTALTEAGNRGPWSVAAEINLLGPSSATTTAGRWDAPTGFPIVPAAAAMLPNGKVLTWSAYQRDNFGGANGYTQTATLDLSTGTVSQATVSNTGHDMFCPGTAMLSDGRVLVNGGSNSNKTSIYDSSSGAWSASSPLVTPRGYQSAVTLSDGQVFTLGGSWSGGTGGKNGEIWSPSTGSRALPDALVGPAMTADRAGAYRADNHMWLFAWTNGRVFQAGPSKAMNWYGTSGTGSVAAAGTRGDDTDAMNGNAVMYEPGHILTTGGAPSYENSNATRNAYVVDITGAAVSVRKLDSMANARAFSNSVALPDGKVLVVGGQNYPVPFSDNTSVLTPELWDPATSAFTALAPMTIPRNYHSIALLLPDGRVLSGGGGLCGSCGTNHFDAQVFTPPYLLNADGTPRPRPAITAAPAAVTAGSNISVTTDRNVSAFSLVRMGSATHTVDTDQRRIPLTISGTTGTTATLTVPADRGVLVPGYYMLFALDSAGVPSVSKVVKVT
jgi:galactose oxidase